MILVVSTQQGGSEFTTAKILRIVTRTIQKVTFTGQELPMKMVDLT